MKFKSFLFILISIFILLGVFIYIEPSITGLASQDRFMISDVKVSADEFDQEVKVEQFDEHELKFDDALYYFTIKPEYEQEIDYVLIEFIADSSQISNVNDVSLYLYKDKWLNLKTEFVKKDGRFLYYQSKSDEFGLFAAGLVEKTAVSLVSKSDVILFSLLPLLGIILLFSVLSYGFVRMVQWINYRVYLFFRKVLFGLIKFVLSFGIVVIILDLISPKYGDAASVNLIYYAVIPLVLFSLGIDLVLNFVLWVRRLVCYSGAYRFFRNWFLLFIIGLAGIFSFLIRFVPELDGSVTKSELIIFGLLPVIFTACLFALVLSLFYVLIRRLIYSRA